MLNTEIKECKTYKSNNRYGILMSIDTMKYSATSFIATMVVRKQTVTLYYLEVYYWLMGSNKWFWMFRWSHELINKIKGDELWHSLGARVVKKDKISLIYRIYMLIYIGNYEELEHCRIAGESVKVTLIKFNACIWLG